MTSMTRMPMARWFELVLESLGNSSNNLRKQIFCDILGKIFLIYHKVTCMLCMLSSGGDSNKYTEPSIHYIGTATTTQ